MAFICVCASRSPSTTPHSGPRRGALAPLSASLSSPPSEIRPPSRDRSHVVSSPSASLRADSATTQRAPGGAERRGEERRRGAAQKLRSGLRGRPLAATLKCRLCSPWGMDTTRRTSRTGDEVEAVSETCSPGDLCGLRGSTGVRNSGIRLNRGEFF